MSESQERMMAVVRPEDVDTFMEICAKWDVLATVVGEVIEGDRLIIDWHGERVVDVDPRTVAHDGPVYDRPYGAPELDRRPQRGQGGRPAARPVRWRTGRSAPRRISSPNQADKSWVTDQYDRYVRGNSVLAQPRTPACCASTRRRGSASRWPTPTIRGSAC
jgi:phosphoribosylformylglycinamidine synthase